MKRMRIPPSSRDCAEPGTRLRAGERGPLVLALAPAAVVLVAVGGFLALLLPLSPGRLERPSADLIPELPHWAALAERAPAWLSDPSAVAFAVLFACAAAFGAWALAIAACWGRPAERGPLALVVGTSLLVLGISAAALPNVSTDVYNYIARGRLASAHGVSPYQVAVDAFPGDPVYPYASHRFTAEPGGKLAAFMLLDVALTELAGESVVRQLLAYRIALFLLAAASLALVAAILRRLAPGHLLAGLVLFGWSPIVTFHGPAKSDTAMAFLLLVALWLLARGRRRFAAVALTGSVLVKLLTLPLAALWGLRELRLRGLREAALGAGLAVATTAALYLPFGSFDAVLRHALQVGDGGAGAPGGLDHLARGAFILLFLAVAFTRTDDLASLVRGGAWLMLALTLLLTPFPLSWYQISVLAIACLVADVRVALAALALGFPAFGLNVWHSTSTESFPLPDAASLAVPLLLALPAFALAGAALLFPGLLRGRAREGVPRADTRLDVAR
jgi:hypothetical protein